MRKKPKTGEGRGNKRRQSQPGRDVGGAKHETGRNGQNDKRHGRADGSRSCKEGNKESEQNKIMHLTHLSIQNYHSGLFPAKTRWSLRHDDDVTLLPYLVSNHHATPDDSSGNTSPFRTLHFHQSNTLLLGKEDLVRSISPRR
ncbi:hypothetical protein TNCV_2581351 [Trichonephila clavipes]|nr:hypothetical protein TNCV_2581351 [Trichonephila clavipes]